MDVDRPAVELAAQFGRQHLHVAGKDHQLGAGLLDHLQHLALLRRLVMRVEGKVVIGNAVPVGQGLEVRVVGNHRHHLHAQLADALAIEQVVEAVIGLGHHDHHFRPVLGRGQLEQHAERIAPLGQPCAKAGLVEVIRLAEFHANEEASGQPVIERMVLSDVAVLFEQVTRHHIHRTQQARAIGGENPGVRGTTHGIAP
ncbi:hypothetical protein D3C80_1067510 [compost metagenome]